MELKKRSKQIHKHGENCNIHVSGWMTAEKISMSIEHYNIMINKLDLMIYIENCIQQWLTSHNFQVLMKTEKIDYMLVKKIPTNSKGLKMCKDHSW